jgi:hypothetical protein
MEYERNMFLSLERFCFHNENCYFDFLLLSYFHYWILILKLVLSRSEEQIVLGISFNVFRSRF